MEIPKSSGRGSKAPVSVNTIIMYPIDNYLFIAGKYIIIVGSIFTFINLLLSKG